MNITGENPLLFKCGKKGFMNQTYPPLTIYKCGIAEGKMTAKKGYDSSYSIVWWDSFLTNEPDGMVIECGKQGFLNATNARSRDYYACGVAKGGNIGTNAGASSFKSSRSLVKVIIFFMLAVYAIEYA